MCGWQVTALHRPVLRANLGIGRGLGHLADRNPILNKEPGVARLPRRHAIAIPLPGENAPRFEDGAGKLLLRVNTMW